MYLQSGRFLKFDISATKRAFYAACNSIFVHGPRINEIALLCLQETYSLCVHTYVIPALSLTAKQIDKLNVCWNSVVRKLFGYNKWESVSAVLLCLGRLNVEHLIILRKVKFYQHLLYDCDAFLCDVFLMFLLHIF